MILRQAGCRRQRRRMSARLPASVHSTAGSLSGMLLDLSLGGARFRVADTANRPQALQAGRDVMLKWDRFQAMGTIRWISREAFGLEFDPSITPKVLIATREQDDANAGYLPDRRS